MGTLVGSVVSMCPSGFIKKVYEGKRCVFKEKRNKCRVGPLDSIVVQAGENSKYMGLQRRKSVGN